MKAKIYLKQGDITDLEVDAIVNAANTELILGGGVAGAIREKGGNTIQDECNKIGIIPLGEAAVTGAGNLKAKFVIHAASMSLGTWANAKQIRNAVTNSLRRANERKLKSIAFPAIGTGVGAFPIDRCAENMFDETIRYLRGETTLEAVYFILYDDKSFSVFEEKFKEMKLDVQAPA
ncbi:MAG: hypothetical protein A2W23_09090 [Planctomycetes bacterium RBG_16_43_13]|nr:MAG: hypothetical protein A2W23_09090 [Planctomycetes bacterium RBG_16_43_13]